MDAQWKEKVARLQGKRGGEEKGSDSGAREEIRQQGRTVKLMKGRVTASGEKKNLKQKRLPG